MKKLIIVVYIFLLSFISFFTYLYIDQNLSYLKFIYTGIAYNYRFQTATIYIGIIVTLFIYYNYFLKQYQEKKLTVFNIKYLISATVAIMMFSYPAVLSYDIYNYIATAKVIFRHYENPYVVSPAELQGDPLLDFMHASHKTALYGPFWILLTFIPYITGLNIFILTLFSMKLLIAVFYLLTIFLIYKLSLSWYKVLAFSLNPLVISEILISGHNDIVMMFLVLLSYYLIKKKKSTMLSALIFILSIFIKYATLFLIPVFIYIAYTTLKKRVIKWSKVYFYSFILMLIVFLLSPFREEMYPWYAVWFFVFIILAENGKNIFIYIILLMLGLSLKYVPYMYSGLYNQTTIFMRTLIVVTPLLLYLILFFTKKLIYFKNEYFIKKR